jgi:hypothetical protein
VSDARTAAAAAEMASAQKRGLACWFVTTDLRFAYRYSSVARPAGGFAMLLQRSLEALVIHDSHPLPSRPRLLAQCRVPVTPGPFEVRRPDPGASLGGLRASGSRARRVRDHGNPVSPGQKRPPRGTFATPVPPTAAACRQGDGLFCGGP